MNVQDLIGEVAKRHNVLVDPQDPIFVAVTLNELLLADHVQKVQAALDRAEAKTDHATSRYIEKARFAAASLMTDSGKQLGDQLRQAGTALGAHLQHVVRELVLAAEAAAAEAAREKRAARWAAAVAMGCTFVVVGMALVTWLGHPYPAAVRFMAPRREPRESCGQ